MSVEENMAIVRRFFDEVWNEGKEDVVRELVANDWLPSDRALNHIQPRSGTQGISIFMRGYRATFPDLKFTIKRMVAEGDIVVTHFEVHGTHSGEKIKVSFRGLGSFTILPAGRTVSAEGVSINRIVTSEKNDATVRQIKSNDWYWRDLGILHALMAAELPGAGAGNILGESALF